MAIDETIWRPGDDTNVILRKILMTLLASGGATSGGSGGSGGAVTIAEGADVTEGSTTDPAEATGADGTVISQLKGIIGRLLVAESFLSAIDADIGNSNSALGAPGDAAVTNPASSASIVAVLKGLLTTSAGQQRGTLTNASGSIAVGATSQAVAAALATRRYFLFQNISTETMWINFGVAAVADQPSIAILPQASFVMEGYFVSTEAVNVISATAGSKYVAKEA